MCFLMIFTDTNAHQSQLMLTTARNCPQIYMIHRAKIFSAESAQPHLVQILVRSKIKVLLGTHNGMTLSHWFMKSLTVRLQNCKTLVLKIGPLSDFFEAALHGEVASLSFLPSTEQRFKQTLNKTKPYALENKSPTT